MKPADRPHFDVDALRDLSGEKVFARGQSYYRDGQVRILDLEAHRVLAQVAGTEDYRTVLAGQGQEIDGECSCPAYEDWGFCKHMVATALAANAADADGEGIGALARIRDHLKDWDVEALVDMIVGLAERDTALFRRLDLSAAAAHADDETVEARLRKAIDDAVDPGHSLDYYEVRDWAAGVDETLDALAEIASGERAGLALELAEHAIDLLDEAIGKIDDSDGYCVALIDRAREIHLEACRAAEPDPVELARTLFSHEMGGEYDAFHGAAALYAFILGDAGLAEYRRLATEAWDRLPPRVGGRIGGAEYDPDYARLKHILDYFAERDGDVEARLAIRAKDLSSSWDYLQLAEFCLAQGREDDALRYAEEGLWLFEDEQPNERLVSFVVERLVRFGRKGDAVEHLWRAFKKGPSLELYRWIVRLGGDAARDQALAYLESRAAEGKPLRWQAPADLLVRAYMEAEMFDAAWAAVSQYKASTTLKDSLAGASEATHPGEALEVYAERVEKLAKMGGNGCYDEAARLIARMATLRGAEEQAAYVADLKLRFRRKRNLMRLLE